MSLLSKNAVKVEVGNVTFTHGTYDPGTDTAYYYTDEGPVAAAYAVETPEGHILRYDEDDRLIGMTLLSAQKLIGEASKVVVTLP